MEQVYNKEENYKKIMAREKEIKKRKRKIIDIAAISILILLVGTVSAQIQAKIQWDIQFKEYQNREFEIGKGDIEEVSKTDYSEKIEMDYITQDGISARVDSLMMTDDYFEAIVSFKFDEGIKVDSENFSFGFAVYDDENNIYDIATRIHMGSNEKNETYTKCIYEELGVNYKKNDMKSIQLADTSGLGNINAEDRKITSKFTIESIKGFPKSKKLYIRLFDLGYSMVVLGEENHRLKTEQAEDFSISNAEWIFEINVPDKFYERETTQLKLKDQIPGLEIEKMTVTEVGLNIIGKIDGFSKSHSLEKDTNLDDWKKARNDAIHIVDEEGKVYYETTSGTLQEEDCFRMSYDINKNSLDKKLFLIVKIGGQEYKSEIMIK